ncbi:YlbE-like family protein [Bacillus sp. FJAT-45350]|uniref:YlbE-like family protein n=1 Tax=Bacillus sp. FJAT-45350 TaxID=2011014 RepID=UPI000BB6DCAE|nr:YlbE-like family protein [Bacillus sp. FJAT-45350]
MRKEVQYFLNSQPELKQYIRQHPYWYRRLGREPYLIETLKKEADQFYGRTFPQRIEKFQGNLQLAMMLLQMLKSDGTQGAPDHSGQAQEQGS